MSATVIALLIGLWVAVLLPGLLRARREVSPATSILRFNRSMDLLERTRRDASERLAEAPRASARLAEAGAGTETFAAVPSAMDPPGATHDGPDPVPEEIGDTGDEQRWPGPRPRPQHARGRGGPAHRRGQRPSQVRPGAWLDALRRGWVPGRGRRRRPVGGVVARRRRVLAVLGSTTLLGVALLPVLTTVGTIVAGAGAVAVGAYLALLWRLQRRKTLQRRVRHLRGGDRPEAPDGRHLAPSPAGVEAMGARTAR